MTNQPLDLKPCPFCGNKAKIIIHNQGYWNALIQCTVCYCRTDLYNDPTHGEKMVADWNHRTPLAAAAVSAGGDEEREVG